MPNNLVDEGAPPAAAIEVHAAAKSFNRTQVLHDVSLHVAPGSIVALLGPSGCGKTTLLRCIAGLERLDGGSVSVDGRVVSDGSGTFVAPERRAVGMVFQDWALFPHLTVGQNVGYGLGRSSDRERRIGESLELVGLAGLERRMPGTLSGGQQQRVALARALAPRPRALLLDEPFSNLDTSLRVQVRSEVHALLSELQVTTVFVTHDQEEAFVLGDAVAVMDRGRIVQYAPPAELYARPASPWVARFVGDANLIPARADGDVASTALGAVPLCCAQHGPVEVLLRPEEVRIQPGDEATVEVVEFYGHDSVAFVRLDDGTMVRTRTAGPPIARRGDRVAVRPSATAATAYPVDPATTDADTELVAAQRSGATAVGTPI